MAGDSLASFGLREETPKEYSVKEAVLPFQRFPGADMLLGPEMKSTGESMGIGKSFPLAFAKAQLGAFERLPRSGGVLLSMREGEWDVAAELTSTLITLGFTI